MSASPLAASGRRREVRVTEHDRRATGPSTEEVDLDRPRRASEIPSVVHLSGSDRVPARLTLVLVVFVTLAIVKPWPNGPGERPRPAPVLPPPPTAAPTRDPLSAVRDDCQDPPGWRTYSRESWSGGQLRSWRSLQPTTAASSPLDPAIPTIPFVAAVLELGFCAPWTGAERPPDGAGVRAWQILPEASRGEGRQAAPIQLQPVGRTLTLPFGGLFRPPAGSDAGRWPPGTWVFEVVGRGWERWWAAEIGPDGDVSTSGPEPSGARPTEPVP
jgi:hypothetical protein